MINPFGVTKAVDLENDEIARTYVNFSASGPHFLADPKEPMPRFLLGGKGGGRTHLMRYFSYPLQRERSRGKTRLQAVADDGYIGVYLRSSGLNSRRFERKGMSPHQWDVVFAYYMDVWLTQSLVKVLFDINSEVAWSDEEQRIFASEVYNTLGGLVEPGLDIDSGSPLDELLDFLTRSLQSMDRTINRAGLGEPLELDPRSRPGELVFASARAARSLAGLASVRMTFLLDEFENLNQDQQIYVNTLIREKDLATGFIVGSRLWGFRTRSTWSAGEENRLGSEYEQVILEDVYRTDQASFESFCRQMVASRLQAAGVSEPNNISGWFPEDEATAVEYARDLVKKYDPHRRPYFEAFRRSVESVRTDAIANQIIASISLPERPDLEKLALLQIYRAWARTGSLDVHDAQSIGSAFREFGSGKRIEALRTFQGHWRGDMLAQMAVEASRKVRYEGWSQYVEMAGYLPRSLLVILKYITEAAKGFGEEPFASDQPRSLSARAAQVGIRKASDWFALDARPLGAVGAEAARAMDRLGSFLRSMRFSDRPIETTCATVTFSTSGVTSEALEIIEACTNHRLLVRLNIGQRDRNSAELHGKYQLHPMLAPRYDLPTARRGSANLKPVEVNAIFDPNAPGGDYNSVVQLRVGPMTAPFSSRAELF